MTRLCTGVLIGMLSVTAAAWAEGPPRCRVRVALEPETAWVGQQVLYDLLILRRRDVSEQRWERALSFPTFRAEWLPGRAADAPVDHEGESYLAYHERRALFPAHPGRLRIPGASLRCTADDGEEIVAIPSATLDVAPLPELGAPPGFAGLVGRVRVTTSVTPARARIGESVRVSVLAQGTADLWRLASLADTFRAIPDVEVFEQSADTARDAGRRLVVRRYLSLDLVPHRAGPLRIPAVSIPWFDPDTARYREARSEGATVEVLARTVGENPCGPSPARADPASSPRNRRGAIAWALWLAAAAAAVALPLAVLRLRKRRDPHADVEAQIGEAEAASSRGALEEAATAAGSALRAALLRCDPGARSLAAEELLSRTHAASAAGDAARWLERIEHARFAGDPEALAAALGDPGWAAAARALRADGAPPD